MPLFNYRCEACGNSFEELVRSPNEKVICPSCKSELVKKQLPTRVCSSGSAGGSSSGGCSSPGCG